MEDVQIDWLVVFLAAILNLVIGFFWYSKWLFGPYFFKLSKLTEKEMKGGLRQMVFAFLASFVIAFFLAFFEAHLEVTSVSDGMFVGFLVWFGFIASTQISSVIWLKHSFRLFLIESGFRLVSFLVMSGLIGA
jgi:hypothetical protein